MNLIYQLLILYSRIDLHPEGSDEEDMGEGIPDTPPSHRPRFSRYLAIARTTYGEEREEAMRELQEEHRRHGFRPMRRSMLLETGIDRMRRVSRVLNRHSRHEPMQDASPDSELSAYMGGNNPTATAEEISRPPPAVVQNRNYM